MKKFFGQKNDDEIIIDGEELNHLAVLRCTKGEEVLCFAGDEFEYLCQISEINKKFARLNILNKQICKGNPKLNITIFQGLPKAEKLELITQKLCELGASSIVPFESNFTIAKPNPGKIERLNKIAKEASKQCGRSLPLQVENAVSFKQMLQMLKNFDVVLFANEKQKLEAADIEQKQNIAIIVGSEGGFSDVEIQQIKQTGAKCIGLGERILRTETASIALCAIVGHAIGV
ncbi:MAG: 16S rRNA (uracil(1498)-N(3))-methyltransferase [Clostridia bacterium]|nr:16S rRNA (uracil(1498)-N(3))-methyltransferase [Clostridia bacterium]